MARPAQLSHWPVGIRNTIDNMRSRLEGSEECVIRAGSTDCSGRVKYRFCRGMCRMCFLR